VFELAICVSPLLEVFSTSGCDIAHCCHVGRSLHGPPLQELFRKPASAHEHLLRINSKPLIYLMPLQCHQPTSYLGGAVIADAMQLCIANLAKL
jgi:hypothetical protein